MQIPAGGSLICGRTRSAGAPWDEGRGRGSGMPLNVHDLLETAWIYAELCGKPIALRGEWTVTFLQADLCCRNPQVWPRRHLGTAQADPGAAVAGTARYAITFDDTDNPADVTVWIWADVARERASPP